MKRYYLKMHRDVSGVIHSIRGTETGDVAVFLCDRNNNSVPIDGCSALNYRKVLPSFVKLEDGEKGLVSYYDCEYSEEYNDFIPKKLMDDADAKEAFVNDSYGRYDTQFEKYRVTTKIGRLVGKILTKEGFQKYAIRDSDIELFTNKFKSYFSPADEKLEILKGTDLYWGYNEKNYYPDWGQKGALWSSCMRYEHKNLFMELYAESKSCSLLVLLRDKLVTGRALLWKSTDDELLMDRIYTIRDADEHKFKKWAKDNQYYHKKHQSYDDDRFVNPENGDVSNARYTIDVAKEMSAFPYCDTFFNYCDVRDIIYNTPDAGDGDDDTLRSENGETENRRRGLDCGELLDTRSDDVVYIDHNDGYAHIDDTVFSDHCDQRYLEGEAVYSDYEGDWMHENNSQRSELRDDNLRDDGCCYSDYHQSYIPNDESLHLPYRADRVDMAYAELTKDEVDSSDILKEDAVYSKYHTGFILGDNSEEILVDRREELVHTTHIVTSMYSKCRVLKSDSIFIWGYGYVENENAEDARQRLREKHYEKQTLTQVRENN